MSDIERTPGNWTADLTVCRVHGPRFDLSRRCPDCDRPLGSMTFVPVDQLHGAVEALDELHRLILDDMQAATNRDLACDGPVGNEEAEVWVKIEALARRQREGR